MPTATETKWLRKYPKLPGAARFGAYYVRVEVLRAEDKVTDVEVCEFADDAERTARMGFPCQRRVVVGTKEHREPGFIVRESGKRPRWVPAAHLCERPG